MTGEDPLAARDIAHLRADNPGPFSLSGTNTWIVGRDPCWVIDPGPLLEPHVAAIEQEVEARGGLAGIALTHDHADHSEAVDELRGRTGDPPVVAVRHHSQITPSDRSTVGPFTVYAAPGHAPDHVVFVTGDVLFSGDAVLGEGSVFVAPDPGALRGYLDALERLNRLDLALICPGHGPLVTDPHGKITQYVEHRLARERSLLAALDDGRRSTPELLDAVWSDVPEGLRPAAAVTLAAHLDKLREEGRVPAGVGNPLDWLSAQE